MSHWCVWQLNKFPKSQPNPKTAFRSSLGPFFFNWIVEKRNIRQNTSTISAVASQVVPDVGPLGEPTPDVPAGLVSCPGTTIFTGKLPRVFSRLHNPV